MVIQAQVVPVETWPVDRLRADEGNVNTHTEEQVRQIAASIRDFGFNDPICVDQNGVIVEGHGRLLAANYLGMADVPVMVRTFASDNERRAYAIAHNRTQQLSGMDDKIVLNEFDRIGIAREQYDATGFTEDDILFMRIQQTQAEAGAGEEASARFAAQKAPTTTLQFSTQDQLFQWLAAIDWMRDRYPTAIGISDLTAEFMAEFGESLS